MKNMTSEELPLFIEFLQRNLDLKKDELKLYKTFPAKLLGLNHTHLIIPVHDTIAVLTAGISKLEKQIDLLKNHDVLNMNEEQFRKYIN